MISLDVGIINQRHFTSEPPKRETGSQGFVHEIPCESLTALGLATALGPPMKYDVVNINSPAVKHIQRLPDHHIFLQTITR